MDLVIETGEVTQWLGTLGALTQDPGSVSSAYMPAHNQF